jgi:TRAP-type uncharacterized transport system substrate-binding protein
MKTPRLAMRARTRVILLAGLCAVIIGAGLVAYRYMTRPVTLTVAVGSRDGELARAASLVTARLAEEGASVRMKILKAEDFAAAAKAFADRRADLAVVRADVGDLPQARSVAQVGHGVVMLLAQSGSRVSSIEDLKGHSVGVVGGMINQSIVDALKQEYDLASKVTFVNLPIEQVREAVRTRQVAALLVVVPLSSKYLSLVKGLFGQAPRLIPIDSADAIADLNKAFESFTIPRGTFRGYPPLPEDDVSSLRVGFYLVANSALGTDLVADLTQAIMKARRDLVAHDPELAAITSVDADSAYIPLHPGAAAYYNGTQQTFMDRYGDAIYLTPMIAGALLSILAAIWRFLGAGTADAADATQRAVYELPQRIRKAGNEQALVDLETELDQIMMNFHERAQKGDEGAPDLATVNAIALRLEGLLHRQRMAVRSLR